MSILDDVLIEEYNRDENFLACDKERLAELSQLAELSPDEQKERKIREKRIAIAEFDQKKMRAYFEVAGINIEEHIESIRYYNLKE